MVACWRRLIYVSIVVSVYNKRRYGYIVSTIIRIKLGVGGVMVLGVLDTSRACLVLCLCLCLGVYLFN